MTKDELKPLKGFRDFLPEEQRQRDFVLNQIRQTFLNFGFEPLETPALERQSLLLGKYGPEADKLIYRFTDEGNREVGLRYDQTVPATRVIAALRENLGFPFRRSQIQPVWRAEKPQKGRYREFLQCDLDTYGTTSLVADAEIIAAGVSTLKNLGLNVKVLINSRLLLFELIAQADINEDLGLTVLSSIDKLDKIGAEGVKAELKRKKINDVQINSLFGLIGKSTPNAELQTVINTCHDLGVAKEQIEFSPTLVRGLDYYTGTIFELVLPDYSSGSLGGGGRYDNLIKNFSGIDIPAVGLALGFDRIMDALADLNLLPTDSPAKVLVCFTDPYLQTPTLNLVTTLRKQNIPTLLYPDPEAKLDKQLKFADKKQVPFAIILGTKEVDQDKYALKDMSSGEQSLLTLEELLTKLR